RAPASQAASSLAHGRTQGDAPTLDNIATYLDTYLGSMRFPHDQNGIYRPSQRPVQRIGLALEPWPDIALWVQQERLDALFLHRPWRLDIQSFPTDIGILAYHLAFDLTLTFGLNVRLARILQMSQPVPFAFKDAVPLGMSGTILPVPLAAFKEHLAHIFGAAPVIAEPYTDTVNRIAIVAAMTDPLIREAAALHVDLYVTGQLRQPANRAVQETRMTVATIGHAIGELWGLRELAKMLQERWPDLVTVLAPPSAPE
ncbi:MAG: Nif3-like dinuclear metal center hexameric protein, partial [Ktedonobacteraceae bacterium]|nr:Nif3-like dinuclear metal center hexameric protein [Ktedonobacteraceae bacterium]